MKKILLNSWIPYTFMGVGLLVSSNGYMVGKTPENATTAISLLLFAIGIVLLRFRKHS